MTIEGMNMDDIKAVSAKAVVHNIKGWALILGDYKMPIEEMPVVLKSLDNYIEEKRVFRDDSYFCPVCNATVSENANFCSECGKHLEW